MAVTIDPRFVGTWKGSDRGTQYPGEVNHWKIRRTEEGLYFINFETHFDDGLVVNTETEGIWYIEGEYYYASHEEDDELDCYLFVFLAPNAIQFVDTQEVDNKVYQFIDYKIQVD
jgi:hypothetical protein